MTDDQDDWQQIWDERKAGLESILGQAEDGVLTSAVPIYLGGNADVLTFTHHLNDAIVYCSAGATEGIADDPKRYEFVIACEKEAKFGPNLVSGLARYALETPTDPGDTMDIGSAMPKGSSITSLLFLDYGSFEIQGVDSGVLLCLGITNVECDFIRQQGHAELLEGLLKDADIFPKTLPFRKSVV